MSFIPSKNLTENADLDHASEALTKAGETVTMMRQMRLRRGYERRTYTIHDVAAAEQHFLLAYALFDTVTQALADSKATLRRISLRHAVDAIESPYEARERVAAAERKSQGRAMSRAHALRKAAGRSTTFADSRLDLDAGTVLLSVEMHAFRRKPESPVTERIVTVPLSEWADAEMPPSGNPAAYLDLVFHYGQNEVQSLRQRSVSVDDVIRLPDGTRWVVDGVGFHKAGQRRCDFCDAAIPERETFRASGVGGNTCPPCLDVRIDTMRASDALAQASRALSDVILWRKYKTIGRDALAAAAQHFAMARALFLTLKRQQPNRLS
jgi:hypothetical protein